MSDYQERDTPPAARDEDELALLLRIAGTRLEAPVDRSARVRQSVQQYWRADIRRRAARRRMTAALALLSTAAVVALVVRLVLPARDAAEAPAATVATVDRKEGAVRALPDAAGLAEARTLSPQTRVHAGEWVTTGTTGRAALRLSNGASVRLDTESRARLHSARVIELIEGALYVDTGLEVTGLEVRTPLGTARDIGTQFEVRVRASSLRVRVRTGVVELRREDRPIAARPGTELTVIGDSVVSGPISPFGPGWDWIVGLAPTFEIDGRPLAAFLDEISREHGWTLRYGDAALARDAADIILHGSVSGLAPHEALAVTLTTSGLDHRLQDGELLVSRPPDRDGDKERR